MGIRKRGGYDESGRQIPMSINMPQLIFQRAESAPPLPSQMSESSSSIWWEVPGGRGTSAWGESPVSHPPV